MNPTVKLAATYLAKALKRYAESDEPARGILCGQYEKFPVDKKLFRVEINLADPLRFVHEASALEFSPAIEVYLSDLGSIPPMLRKIKAIGLQLECDGAERSYLIHDACYLTGKINVRKPFGKWHAMKITRAWADILLHDCLSADATPDGRPITRSTAMAVYQAVRRSRTSRRAWNRHRARMEKRDG